MRKKSTFLLLVIFFLFHLIPSSAIHSTLAQNGYEDQASRLKHYGVHAARENDWEWLSSQGINTVLIGLPGRGAGDTLYQKARDYGIQLFVWPLGTGEEHTPWHWQGGNEWDIEQGKPLLRELSDHHDVVVAVMSLHEPYWRGGKGAIPSISQKALADKIRSYTRDHGYELKILNMINAVHFWQDDPVIPGQFDWAGIWLHCWDAEGSEEKAKELVRLDRAYIDEHNLNAKLLFSVQTFGIEGTRYRMPSYDEIKNLSCQILSQDALDAFFFYSWGRVSSNFTDHLSIYPELHPIINDIYENCISADTAPSPAQTILNRFGAGAFPSWSPDGSLIAFTRGRWNIRAHWWYSYDIYTIHPDGSNEKCLTCNKKDLAHTRWRGQPHWHPNGDYIVFTAETSKYPRKGNGTTHRPGLGRNHNIWMMKSDGSKFWQITDYPDNWGSIRPGFSHDGKTLYWNEEFSMEKYPEGKPGDHHPGSFWGWENFTYRKGEELGAWRIKLADITFEDESPSIDNIRHIDPPEGFTLIEGAGFTPDDKGFIYSYAPLEETFGRGLWGDIFISDLEGKLTYRLTHTPFIHDENPLFSPDGLTILWNQSSGDPGEGEELWLMKKDGSQKTRLTWFSDPSHTHYVEHARQITEFSWSPDGKEVVLGHVSQTQRGGFLLPSTLYVLQDIPEL